MSREIDLIVKSLNNKDGNYRIGDNGYIWRIFGEKAKKRKDYYLNDQRKLMEKLSNGSEDKCMGFFIDKDGVIKQIKKP